MITAAEARAVTDVAIKSRDERLRAELLPRLREIEKQIRAAVRLGNDVVLLDETEEDPDSVHRERVLRDVLESYGYTIKSYPAYIDGLRYWITW